MTAAAAAVAAAANMVFLTRWLPVALRRSRHFFFSDGVSSRPWLCVCVFLCVFFPLTIDASHCQERKVGRSTCVCVLARARA